MAEINISDLSIGDWVKILVGGKPRYVKVEQIVWNSILNKWTVECNEGRFRLTICAIHPIPLTPEILEKNGFRKNGNYNEWNLGEWDDIPFIGISLDRQSMRIKNFSTDIFISCKVVYVHQLQHALRLAGVGKEIEV